MRVGLRGLQLVSIIVCFRQDLIVIRYRYECQERSAEEIVGKDESDCARVSLFISERALI